MSRQLGNAEGFHYGQGRIEVAGHQHPHFVKRSVRQHHLHPRIASGVEGGTRRLKHHRTPGRRQGRGLSGLPIAERATGKNRNLIRPAKALPVAGRNARLSGGVQAPKRGAKLYLAEDVERRLGVRPRRLRYGGNLGQALRQSAKIHPCSADNHGGAAYRSDPGQHLFSRPQPSADRPGLRPVRRAVKVVRRSRQVARRGSGGQDMQIRVDLHGVGVDDLRPDRLGQLERQRRLAACGRPCDQPDAGRALSFDVAKP